MRALVLIGSLVVLLGWSAAVEAARGPVCTAGKISCVGKLEKALLTCHAKAESKGIAVDPECLSKALFRFDGSGDPKKSCFLKAEAKGSCRTTGDIASFPPPVDDFVLDAVQAVDPAYPAVIENKCSAGKKTCVANLAAALLACHVKAEKKGVLVDPLCLTKASGKFADCIEKRDKNGLCPTSGDATALQTRVDGFVATVIGLLIPRCGDAVVAPGEACDDGNADDCDACRNDCSGPACGNGAVDAICGEVCDPPGAPRPDGVCDSTCSGSAPAPCTSGTECGSGFCVDGFCCESACAGDCESCDQPGREGQCDPLPPGSPTDLTCGPPTTCRQVLALNPGAPDGVYTVYPPAGPPSSVYCDMTTDGGGWTALFIGKNGSPNVFDHFDAGAYAGTFDDPSASQYLQRAAASVGDLASELAVSCGGAMVSFALTTPARSWLGSGTQSGWTPLTPSVIAGTVPNPPNTLWTGTGSNLSFIFARSQAAFGNTFASSYSGNTSYDYCNGVSDQTATVRVFFREAAPTPVHNQPQDARQSCRVILEAGESQGDGNYWLVQPGGSPYQAYCDMTTDGGGWTTVFAGRNGSTNVFGHFDSTSYSETCTDPATHCVRRAPPALDDSASEIAVSCGAAMVAFATTNAARNWLVSGTQAMWAPLTPRLLTGAVTNLPNSLWTGSSAADQSFIFTHNNAAFGNTFASSYATSANFDYCNGTSDQVSPVRVFYREVMPTPVRNTPEAASASCRAILLASESQGDGNYWLVQPGGSPYLAYCDMTTDGGGWTAVFAGRNGQANVFDHFDATSYVGTCTDPASHCLRRAPESLRDSAAEVAVSCGGAMVSFAATNAARELLVFGAQSGWAVLTPAVIAGTVAAVPNSLWTGTGAADQSFIFARNNAAFGNTFASSYGSSSNWAYCNGIFDQASLTRVFYREAAPTPVHNAPGVARQSCRAILDAGESQGDGIYWLVEPGGSPYQAYCDMTTDGGGWTAVFAGRNGSTNVFGHFDQTSYVEECTDPATHCLRRAPASLGDSAADIAVSCGTGASGAMVSFAMTNSARNWLVLGTQEGWLSLTPDVIAGTVVNVPNTLLTGSGAANESFVFARNQAAFGNTFASSYSASASFDYCNNVADQASLARVYYREVAPTPVLNTPGNARRHCRAILEASESLGDGLYWLAEPGESAYLAYCDMTTDGGGWTALFAGRNGSPNVFDRFDVGFHLGICTDPATRCLRRAPASLGVEATDLAVGCGDASVSFPLTAAIESWLVSGTQSGWVSVAASVLAGTVLNVPNTLYTGMTGGTESFILARNQAGFGNTFASSYTAGTGYDYCHGVQDAASLVRVVYR